MRISDWSSDVCSSDLCNGDTDMAISRDLPPLVHGRAIGWQNYVAIQNQPASRLMTDYSWRAGSQADETAVVLKNCVGNACLLTQARLLGHMPQLTMEIGRASCRERVCQYV